MSSASFFKKTNMKKTFVTIVYIISVYFLARIDYLYVKHGPFEKISLCMLVFINIATILIVAVSTILYDHSLTKLKK